MQHGYIAKGAAIWSIVAPIFSLLTSPSWDENLNTSSKYVFLFLGESRVIMSEIGSLTTNKADPKDADLLVTVTDDTVLYQINRPKWTTYGKKMVWT
jgi:hypothetical protein